MIDIYDFVDEKELCTIWLLSIRQMTITERWRVGWRLWRNGVAKFPWIVKQNPACGIEFDDE